MTKLLATVAIALCLSFPTYAGVYQDSAGKKHEWHISDDHSMIWDGERYIPIGGMFVSRYVSNPTAANLSWDRQTLQKIRSAGVRDIYVNASFTRATPGDFQKVIDLLEELGFRYGIQAPVSMKADARGYYIDPAAYIAVAGEDGKASVDMSKKLPKSIQLEKSGLYLVYNRSGKYKVGNIQWTANSATISDAVIRRGDTVKIVPAVVTHNWIAENPDKLLAWLKSIRPGAGYRLLLDPMGNEYSPPANFWPSPEKWGKEYAAWLAARGGASNEVNVLPVTSNIAIDLATNKAIVGSSSASSWKSTKEAIDDVLRSKIYENLEKIRQISGIPIVAKRHRQATRIWISLDPKLGFDGLGADSYGSGSNLLRFNALQAYVEASQSRRPTWVLTTEYSHDAKKNNYVGYKDSDDLWSGITSLLSNGSRGVYVFGLSLSSNDNDRNWANYDLVKSPENLKWLSEYKVEESTLSLRPKVVLTYKVVSDDLRPFLPDAANALNGAHAGPLSTIRVPSGYVMVPAFYKTAGIAVCTSIADARSNKSCSNLR
ncbi:MAG: hypothetical protein QM581_11105 [Pseudomonas sp.]